jgi:Tfp pilus assembly protein PilV
MNKHRQTGFTVIETMVTVIVAVIFIMAINVLFIAVIKSSSSSSNRTTASMLAYSNLRKYAFAGAKPTWFTDCANADMQTQASPPGQTLESGTLTTSQVNLPQPITYSVIAFAPYGCSGPASGSPLLVRSKVTYGPDNLSVTHATYVGYQ